MEILKSKIKTWSLSLSLLLLLLLLLITTFINAYHNYLLMHNIIVVFLMKASFGVWWGRKFGSNWGCCYFLFEKEIENLPSNATYSPSYC